MSTRSQQLRSEYLGEGTSSELKIAAFEIRDLIEPSRIFQASILAKLQGLGSGNQFRNFNRCGQEKIYRTCKNCSGSEVFEYHCNIKWCPRCNWRITRDRSQILQAWTKHIHQPKHIVLTQKNFPVLTRRKIREHQKNLARLRRNKIWKNVKGGSVSVEITNDGKGWHLHSHWLVDCRWIDAGELAKIWGGLCGQEFGIVKVKDSRDTEYLHEVSKYVCKPSELAKWTGEEIWEFISAIRGLRFFFAFGSLFKLGSQIRSEMRAKKPPQKACECGCRDFIFRDEVSEVLNEIRQTGKRRKK